MDRICYYIYIVHDKVFSHLINIAMELWRLRHVNRWNLFEDKCLQHAILLLRPLTNSSGILLGSGAHLDRLVARFWRWYKVSFDKCSLWFSINVHSMYIALISRFYSRKVSRWKVHSYVIASKFVSPNIHS